jgi:hypothetical protein
MCTNFHACNREYGVFSDAFSKLSRLIGDNTAAHKPVSSNSNCGARRSDSCELSICYEISNYSSGVQFRNESRCDFIS